MAPTDVFIKSVTNESRTHGVGYHPLMLCCLYKLKSTCNIYLVINSKKKHQVKHSRVLAYYKDTKYIEN